MKKWLALAMAAFLAFGAAAETVETVDTAAVSDYDHVTVGSTTALSGDFFTGMWGNSSVDLDVRALLHASPLTVWLPSQGSFSSNPSVTSGIAASANPAGDRIYTVVIRDDLKYSDGSAITAKDYAFSMLLSVAPQIAALGGNTTAANYILGMDDYVSGKSDVLTGVHIVNDTTLSVTVKHEYTPFFYELEMLAFNPSPISVIAPGCSVVDDGKGVRIEGEFTADLLRKTLLDGETGYISHPTVVSGPYMLTSYDTETRTAEFKRNPYYAGNADGVKPAIETITYVKVNAADMFDKLASGDVNLLNKITRLDSIELGREKIADSETLTTMNYARSGMTFINFSCERAAVSSQKVRQAIAMCLDRDAYIAQSIGEYGIAVNGYYGIGQWMTGLVNGSTTTPLHEENAASEEAAWEALTIDDLPTYALNIDAAVALLVEDGWTLNSNGEAFDPAKDDIRCKRFGDELVALDLSMICGNVNNAEEILQETFVANLVKAGIRLTVTTVDGDQVLSSYYRKNGRDCDMILMGSNFAAAFDPAPLYVPSDAETGLTNYSGLKDEELYKLAVDMRTTEPGDVLGYCTKWVAFQHRWADVLPAIPLYSNVYFDFYSETIHDYEISTNLTCTEALAAAYMGDAGLSDDEIEELGEDEVIIEE